MHRARATLTLFLFAVLAAIAGACGTSDDLGGGAGLANADIDGGAAGDAGGASDTSLDAVDTSGTSDSVASDSLTGGDAADPDAVETSGTADGTADSGTPDAASDAATAPDASPPGPQVVVHAAPLVELAVFGDALPPPTCAAYGAGGLALPDPGDWQISAAGGSADGKGGWTFAKPGAVAVTCSSATLGASGGATVVVVEKAVDPALSRLTRGLHRSAALVPQIVAAAGDAAQLAPLTAELTETGRTMRLGFFKSTALVLPRHKWWPSAAKVQKAGWVAGPDDDAWAAAIAAVGAAAEGLSAALATTPALGLDAAAAAKIESATKALHGALAAATALKPSPLAWWTHRDAVEAAVGGKLVAAISAHHGLVAAALQDPKLAPPKGCLGCWGLAQVATALAMQYALESIPTYNGFLQDCAQEAGNMLATSILGQVLETAFPPGSGGPSIGGTQGVSSAGVFQDKPLKLWGYHFDDAGCQVFVVTPLVTGTVLDGIKTAMGGAPEFGNLASLDVWEAAKVVKSSIDTIKGVSELINDKFGDLAEKGVLQLWTKAVGADDEGVQELEFGTVPMGINCGKFPQPLLIWPMCPVTGRGKLFQPLVLPAQCPPAP